MSITLKNAEKTYDSHVVLHDVSFSLNEGNKVVVIGENGAGKSTLLKLLLEENELTHGQRITGGYVTISFVGQEFPREVLERNITGEQYALERGGDSVLRITKRVMKEFGLGVDFLTLPLQSFSGGQRKIIDLSIAFAEHSDYLLLDEPENHIDIIARQSLIAMLNDYRGGLVFVSHDQNLINSVTNRIVEIEDGELTAYKGNYEFYLEEKARQEAGRKREWQTHQRKVEQLDKLIKRMRVWVQVNPDLGAQLRARKTQLRHLEEHAPKKPKVHKRAKISTNEIELNRSKRILLADHLSLRRGTTELFRDLSLSLFFGQKVTLIGRNGTGKTSFLKAVTGDVPYDGVLKVGVNVKVGYFSQEAADTLDPDKTPLDTLSYAYNAPEHQVRAMLARYLIDVNHCTRKIATLSGGQKTRLRFCLLFAAKPDLLLLDEPTNHLDPVTWDLLAQAINEYQGTLILVSHDRFFIDQVAKELWVVENGTIRLFRGTLSEYLQEEV